MTNPTCDSRINNALLQLNVKAVENIHAEKGHKNNPNN